MMWGMSILIRRVMGSSVLFEGGFYAKKKCT